MSRYIPGVGCCLAALFLAACTVEQKPAPRPPAAPAPVAAPAPAAKPDAFPPIKSQQEADAKAAQAISKENADAELEKLKKELAGGQ